MCFISGSVTVYDTTQLPQGEFSRQRFSERPMSSGYFGRLIATGERGVCLLSSCKVRYPQNKNSFEKSLMVKILSLDI